MQLKQIIIATNDREKLEKATLGKGCYVTWCALELDDILRVRDRSNVLFLCPKDEEEDDLKRIGLYLRDLCIEDEKIVYIYGSRRGVDILVSKMPVMFTRMYSYASQMPFTVLLDDLAVMEKEMGSDDRPAILLLDDKTEYIEKLRVYLEPFFHIYVNHFDMDELGFMILRSDVILVGMDKKLTLVEYMDIFRVIYHKMKQIGFHLYYLTATNDERDRVNSGNDRSGMAFSREMGEQSVANYLKRKYAKVE
ncbi:MAG: hypothetical protein K6C95_08905 [Lachnospiraceae bacterium]|nr:hypothetical protein [Lachnospiraceae bacterium]